MENARKYVSTKSSISFSCINRSGVSITCVAYCHNPSPSPKSKAQILTVDFNSQDKLIQVKVI